MATRQQQIVNQLKFVMAEYDKGLITMDELNRYMFTLVYCLFDRACPLPV